MRRFVFLFAALILVAQAQQPVSAKPALLELESPEVQDRVRGVSEKLRCLVCQNQTIADSNAPLAKDLRNAVIDQVKSGKKDKEIIDFMVERYGDFVLYEPPMKASTLLLWFGPLIFLALALLGFIRAQRRSTQSEEPLSDKEKAHALALLEEKP